MGLGLHAAGPIVNAMMQLSLEALVVAGSLGSTAAVQAPRDEASAAAPQTQRELMM